MNRNTISTILAALVAAVVLAGCSFGLIPAWKNKNTALAFRIESVVSEESLSSAAAAVLSGSSKTSANILPEVKARAVAQGGGYLYIRTLGGPAGEAGPFYGPYTATPGQIFKTTEIPAGAYSGMGIIYSATPLESKSTTFDDKPISFTDAMKLPDADFERLCGFVETVETGTGTTGTTGEQPPSAFDQLFYGDTVSGKMLKDVTLVAGVTNTFKLSLEPMVSDAGSVVNFSSTTRALLTGSGTLQKKFLRLEGVTAPTGFNISSLICTATPSLAGATVTIGNVILFDATGSALPGGAFLDTTTLTGEAPSKGYTVPCSLSASEGYRDFYLYIEYIAPSDSGIELNFSTTQSMAPGVSLLKATYQAPTELVSKVANKTLFFGAFKGALPEKNDTSPMAGFGMFTLDSAGCGNGYLLDIATGNPLVVTPGDTYCLMGFVDGNSTYSYVTPANVKDNLACILPCYGDSSIDGPGISTVVAPGENTVNLATAPWEICTNLAYYVSTSGGGTGQTKDSPMTLDAVFSDIPIKLDGKPDGYVEVYLTDNLSLAAPSVPYWIGYPLSISSTTTTPCTITVSGQATANLFAVISGQLRTGNLNLNNVIVDGITCTGAFSPFSVSGGGCLYIGQGATIQNFNVSEGNGGAVTCISGNVYMDGGAIKGCAAVNGGGVYLGPGETMNPSSLTMNGASEISGCVATGNGGGVYVGSMARLTFEAGSTSKVTGNKAGSALGAGGGVFITGGSVLAPGHDVATLVMGNTLNIDSTVDDIAGGTVDTKVYALYVSASGGGDGTSESSPTNFATALSTANTVGSDVNTIILTGDVTLGSGLGITAGRTITIRSDHGYGLVLVATIGMPFITVAGNATLNLDNVQVGPLPENKGSINAPTLVEVDYDSVGGYSGNLNLNEGAVLRNNASAGNGGAVVLKGGTLTMNGGTITNCSAAGSLGGGAVYAETSTSGHSAYVNMYNESGTISNCSASAGSGGGIYVAAPCGLMINSAKIYGCTAFGNGGGVYAASSDNLRLTTAKIENCTATNGGGMYLGNVATTNGGTSIEASSSITNCSANGGNGGGIYADASSNLTVYDTCAINGCTAQNGGGIYVAASGSMCLYGGNISTCSATVYGGGVYAATSSTVKLDPVAMTTNYSITGNNAANAGGGLYKLTGTTFIDYGQTGTMATDLITGNTAGITPVLPNTVDIAEGA